MRYTLSLTEETHERIAQLFDGSGLERAGYLFCRTSVTRHETRLLGREFIPVDPSAIDYASSKQLVIDASSYTRAMAYADRTQQNIIFVHTHPAGPLEHSSRDDREERRLFKTIFNRVHGPSVHGSLVLTEPQHLVGRVWVKSGATYPLDRIRILGKRFRFIDNGTSLDPRPDLFDRQILAFGEDTQRLLRRLNVGIVGGGGTGSAVGEQLIRLGVGKLTIADDDRFSSTNVTRVYGSTVFDEQRLKTEILARSSEAIGLGTEIVTVPQSITLESAMSAFRDCDVIFCCVDKELPRSILTRFAIYYLIPVFDMGVRIDSDAGFIRSVAGHVTTLLPGTPCLFCRDRISVAGVTAEAIEQFNPPEARRLRAQGYAPEITTTEPAVIFLTTMVAASSVSEFFHRLTGYMGFNRNSSETLLLFTPPKTRTITRTFVPGCFCGDRTYWANGDESPLLGLTWGPAA